MKSHGKARSVVGLSLLEVVLAMSILAGAVAVMSQLVGLGMRAAAQARDLTKAQILAESLMSEMTAGIYPAEPFGPIDVEPGWMASAYLQPTMHQGIVQMIVIVEETSPSRRAARYELSRWMRDPTLEIPTEPTEEASEGSADSGSAQQGSDTAPASGDDSPPPDGGSNAGPPPAGGDAGGPNAGGRRGGNARSGGDAGGRGRGGQGARGGRQGDMGRGRGGGNAGPGAGRAPGGGRAGRGGGPAGAGRGAAGGGRAGAGQPGRGSGAPGGGRSGAGQPGRGAGQPGGGGRQR